MNTPEPFNDLSWNDDPLHSPNRTEYIEKLRARVKVLEGERDRTQGNVCSFCNWANVGTLNIGDPNETSIWICHGCVKRQYAKLATLEKEVSRLKDYLERAGWGECNIPACNCNGWHKLRESRDEREQHERHQEELAELTKEREQLKGEVLRWKKVLEEIANDDLDCVSPGIKRMVKIALNPTPHDTK